MEWKTIRRGGIRSAAYDRRSRTLEVEFDTRRVLRFRGVGEEIAEGFLASSSPMSYYRDRIEEDFEGEEVSSRAEAPAAPTSDAKKARGRRVEAAFRRLRFFLPLKQKSQKT